MDTTPLRIGYCLSLSGALASNGKTARLAHQIWQENVNTNGKLLGRPVELVCLDDQTNPKLVADLPGKPRTILRGKVCGSSSSASIPYQQLTSRRTWKI
jgi:hypothetical protein